MTQEEIYQLAKSDKTDKIKEAKEKGLIAYDHHELLYRPIEDIGKPLDEELYFKYFPQISESERVKYLKLIEDFRGY